MGIKRRYKRLRYYCSWKYPKLFRFVRTITFPTQVLALCLGLFAIVTFYQKNFSFEATMRARTAVEDSLPERTLVSRPDTEITTPDINNITQTGQESDQNENQQAVAIETDHPTATETAIIAAIIDPPITGPIPSGTALIQRTTTPLPRPTVDSPAVGDPEPLETPELLVETEAKEVLDSEWLAKQGNKKFVIQLATSSRYAELIKYAEELPVDGPLVIYPYKTNSSNGLVYGLAAGLHDSIAEANAALATLPKESGKFGYWIRAVARINSQVKTLEDTK